MPRRFFRKFTFKRKQLSQRWFMLPFTRLLHDHRLWGVRRKNVVPAFALGVFVGFMPFPGHLASSALLALALRVNIPAAAIATFISNPITMAPMYYFNYRVGLALLSMPPSPFEFDMSFAWVTDTFVLIWQPMLLGSVLCGALASLVALFGLDFIWRMSLASYKTKKRDKRR